MDNIEAKLINMDAKINNINKNLNEIAKLFHIQTLLFKDLAYLIANPNKIKDQSEEFLNALSNMNLRKQDIKDS